MNDTPSFDFKKAANIAKQIESFIKPFSEFKEAVEAGESINNDLQQTESALSRLRNEHTNLKNDVNAMIAHKQELQNQLDNISGTLKTDLEAKTEAHKKEFDEICKKDAQIHEHILKQYSDEEARMREVVESLEAQETILAANIEEMQNTVKALKDALEVIG